jgi:hypothetical protein
MLTESLAVLASVIVLGLMGVGPALWLMTGERRVVQALAAAPALGFALLAIIGFPLVRFVGPVRMWAWPLTIICITASLTIGFIDWRRRRTEYQRIRLGSSLANLGFMFLCGLILISPLLLNGIQYAVFRSNPSDAFLYMSLAETTRVVNWNSTQHGTALTSANLEGITHLAELSPTALFSARHIALPLVLNQSVVLAWSAQVARRSIPGIYLANHFLALLLALPLALVLAHSLSVPKWQVYLGGAAIVLGFWARFVIETDAGYEISELPLTLLFVVAWLQLEMGRFPILSRERVLMAVTAAAVAVMCCPVALVLGVAVLIHCGMGMLKKETSFITVWQYGLTALMGILVLALSGQLDYLIQAGLNLAARAGTERLFPATAMDLIKTDGLAALWGLPPSILWKSEPLWIRWPLDHLAMGLGLFFAVLVLVGATMVIRKTGATSERIVYATLAGGAAVSFAALVTDNDRSAGKAMTYVYPFLTLVLLVALRQAAWLFTYRGRILMNAALGGWLAVTCLAGTYLVLRGHSDFLTQTQKDGQYDLSAITSVLDKASPRLLLVDVPRRDTWMFAFYSQFIFSRYPAHFQRGLVIDNSTANQNLWLHELRGTPDYAVIAKDSDYIGSGRLGIKLAETPDLVLYKIESADASVFEVREMLYREQETALASFPTLQH